jgi:oligopeptide transport system substrate-binding protein
MARVLLIPTVLLIVLGAVCFALSGGGVRGGIPRTITVANMDEIKTLDVGRMSWQSDIRTAMALWEGLLAYDPATAKPVAGTAGSWDVSSDLKTYTFHLRPEAKWSNGEPVRAGDFVFAWKRVLTPATGADYVELLYVIDGAEAYTAAWSKVAKGEEPDFSRVGVQAADDHTLVVRLRAPCSYFLDLCAFPPLFPLNAASMRPFLLPGEKDGGQYDGRWTRPPGLVTNGAYVLTDWKFKEYLSLEPNPHYWDRKNVKTDRLVIKALSDPRAALLAFDSGTVDALTFIPQQFIEDLLAQKDPAQRRLIHYQPVFGTYYFEFNCTRGPLADKRVRKALCLAVDRQKIVDDVTRMHQRPLGVIVPPDAIPGYVSPEGLGMDVEAARKLLAEAGYPGGKGIPPLEILYNNETIHGQIAMALGQMWEQSLGLHFSYRGLERGSFSTERRENHNFDICRGGWYGDYTDPTTWLDLARSTNGNNDGKFNSPAYDALLDEAAREGDPQKRMAILSAAEKLLVTDECPFIPLYQYGDGYMYDDRKLSGMEVNVRLMTQYKWIARK